MVDIDRLAKDIKAGDWVDRRNAVWELRKVGGVSVVPLLIEALEDNYWEVRLAAAEVLGHIGDASAAEALVKATKDPDGDVRGTAVKALERIQEGTPSSQGESRNHGPDANAGEWPTFGHDGGSTQCDGSVLRPPLVKTWECDVGGNIHLPIVPACGMVLVESDRHYLCAIDAATGRLRWKSKKLRQILNSPVVSKGTVYLALDDRVLALDAWTGEAKFEIVVKDGIRSSPSVGGGMLYLCANNERILAFDASNGKAVWQLKTRWDYYSPPVISGGTVLVAGAVCGQVDWERPERSSISAVDGANGTISWQREGFYHRDHSCLISLGPDYRGQKYVLSAFHGPRYETYIEALSPDSGRSLGRVWQDSYFAPFSMAANGNWIYLRLGQPRGGDTPTETSYSLLLQIDGSARLPVFGLPGTPCMSGDYVFAAAAGGLKSARISSFQRWMCAAGSPGMPAVIARGMLFAADGKTVEAFEHDDHSQADSAGNAGGFTSGYVGQAQFHEGAYWPNMCCLCGGPAETKWSVPSIKTYHSHMSHSDEHWRELDVPYCRRCLGEVTHQSVRENLRDLIDDEYKYRKHGIRPWLDQPAGSSADFQTILLFRNRDFWVAYMNLNHYR